ncbi:hypothetical protein ABK040_006677 [Willaertia magna]
MFKSQKIISPLFNKATTMTELFVGKEHTNKYAQFRPTYPIELFQTIFSNIKTNKESIIALDVGCGSGQATKEINKLCKYCIGIDPSKNQIQQAKQLNLENVDFIVGTDVELVNVINNHVKDNEQNLSANIEINSNSPKLTFDLIVVAQSLHWFDFERFFQQVDQLLSKDGVFAAWTYILNHFEGENGEEATKVLNDFYKTIWEGGYWSERRKLVDEKYETIPHIPYKDNIKRIVVDYKVDMSLEQYINYIGTWSSIQDYSKKNGEEKSKELLDQLLNDLKNAFGYEESVKVVWPIHLVLTKKLN